MVNPRLAWRSFSVEPRDPSGSRQDNSRAHACRADPDPSSARARPVRLGGGHDRRIHLDAARFVPDQPHMLRAHGAVGDRRGQHREPAGGSSPPGSQRRPGTRSSACASIDPASRRRAVQHLPQERERGPAAVLLRQTPGLHHQQLPGRAGACYPPGPCDTPRRAASRRPPRTSRSRLSSASSTSNIRSGFQATVQPEFGDHEEMLDPATDNFRAVHRAIAGGRVKQFLTFAVDKLRGCTVLSDPRAKRT